MKPAVRCRRLSTVHSAAVPPWQSSVKHHDIGSFLRYAERTGLSQKSPVFVGTHYEYTILHSLHRYGFLLKRTGGASDLGIDLVGTWKPPSTGHEFKVIVQCKAGLQHLRPSMLRELEGAFIGAPPGWRGASTLGFLISEQSATRGIRDSLGRSRWPMGFMCSSREGHITQIIWNQSAIEGGLEGFGVGIRYSNTQAQLDLMYMKKALPQISIETDDIS